LSGKFATNILNFKNNEIAIYGSSYTDHVEFKKLLKKLNLQNINNYSQSSYGLDQIYLSYKLTAHLNQNRLVLIGFLLEDLDRSIFNLRDYNKPKFNLNNNNLELTNVPISNQINNKFNFEIYSFKLISNFIKLVKNNFDLRQEKCFVGEKKDLFLYFLNDINKDIEKYNQKLVVITFNIKEDFTNQLSWRYNFIKNYFKKKNIIHIDAYKILNNHLNYKSEDIDDYFGDDLHNSLKSFNYIFDELKENYNAM